MSAARTDRYPSWVPYVIPIAIFLLITQFEGDAKENFPYVYIGKVVLVTAVLIFFRQNWKDIKFESKWILPSVVVGIIVFVVWIWGDPLTPHFKFMARDAFNPMSQIANDGLRGTFIAFRFYGLILLVPVMEELFWRSFLLRYASNPDWEKLAIGSFTATGFIIVALLFGFSHPEWAVAIFTACAYALLLRWSRSVFACIVAHSVSNAALGIYVMKTGAWQYW